MLVLDSFLASHCFRTTSLPTPNLTFSSCWSLSSRRVDWTCARLITHHVISIYDIATRIKEVLNFRVRRHSRPRRRSTKFWTKPCLVLNGTTIHSQMRPLDPFPLLKRPSPFHTVSARSNGFGCYYQLKGSGWLLVSSWASWSIKPLPWTAWMREFSIPCQPPEMAQSNQHIRVSLWANKCRSCWPQSRTTCEESTTLQVKHSQRRVWSVVWYCESTLNVC